MVAAPKEFSLKTRYTIHILRSIKRLPTNGQAWFYPGVVAVSCIPLTRLIMNDPIVVESRTKMGPAAEQHPTQKVIILFMVLPGIALFIVTDLYQRFGWSSGRSGLS